MDTKQQQDRAALKAIEEKRKRDVEERQKAAFAPHALAAMRRGEAKRKDRLQQERKAVA